MGMDITAIKQAQAALERHRDRLEETVEARTAELRAYLDRYVSLLEVTGQIGWTTNAAGEAVEDLPTWRSFTGQSAEAIRGWGWAEALHPDDRARTMEAWQKAVRERKAYETEYRVRRQDGTYRDFLARGVPTFNVDGSLREWVGVCIDITERKRVEEQLRQAVAELAANNAELARFNEAMVGRELRLIELKKEVNEACAQADQAPRYKLEFENGH
jgi:PAS domain S-box-containing protein